MKTTSLRRIELTMFSLHPEVKPLYKALKHISNGDINFSQSPRVRSHAPATRKSYKKHPSIKSDLYKIICGSGRFTKMKAIEKQLQLDGIEFAPNVSYLLNQMKSEGLITSFSPSGSRKDYYWGLPNWLDNIGYPKPQNHYLSKLQGGLF